MYLEFIHLTKRKTFNHVYVDAVMSVQTVCLMYKLMMYSASGGDVCSSSWTRHQGSDPCCQLRLSQSLRGLRTQMWVGRVNDLILVVNYDCPNHYEDYVHRCGWVLSMN